MRLYLRALTYFREDWKLVGLWISLIATATGIGLLTAWPMAVLVDAVLTNTRSDGLASRVFLSILPAGVVGQIVGLALIGLLLKLSQDGLGVLQAIVCNHLNYNGLLRVRRDLYRKLQALNLTYHRSQPQGDAIYRLSSDTFGCQAILGVTVGVAIAVLTLAVMTMILMTRSVPLTLLAFSITPVLVIANIVFGRRLKTRSLECKEFDTQFTTTVQRSISTISLVQAFGRERAEYGRFHNSVRAKIAAWWRLNQQQFAYNILIGAAFGIGTAIVFGYGGYLVYQDQFVHRRPDGMTIGDLLIFMQYIGMLWGPLCTLTGFPAAIQNGAASCQRVFEVLDRDPVIADQPGAVPLPVQPREIVLHDLSFGYDKERLVLKHLNVQIKPGEMVAFVGPSGVGKSTLLNLLPRFYDPTSGSITLDGVDLRSARLRDVRRHVALVLQEAVILPTTIAENIAYGRPGATEQQIREAAHLAHCGEFIESLKDGYHTAVAEGGSNLSGGQRQRIAIARALLTRAPIIILDEPTSALDPHHEHLVTQSLKSIKRSRTTVIVSHRLSTVMDCDRIYVMDKGAVVEAGTHDELIRAAGLYCQMACHQMLVSETEPIAA